MRTCTLTAVLVLAALAGLAPEALAATIPVTTLDDLVSPSDGVCSLREAMLAVATPPGAGDCVRADANANTISLGPGKHVLTRTGPAENAGSVGDLDIDSGTVSLTVSGAGAGATSIDAAGLADRLVDIAAGSPSVAFQNLTLAGGRAPDGVDGLEGIAGTAGESGGAIRSAAPLSLTDVSLRDNRAGDGGAGGFATLIGGVAQPGPTGGAGGNGGAIHTTSPLTLTRVALSFNFGGAGGAGGSGTTDGTNGGSDGGAGGAGGTGGSISGQGGPTEVSASRFDGNQAGAGGAGGRGGPGGSQHRGGTGGAGAPGGAGGGVRVTGPLTISGSTFTANAAGAGGTGGEGGDSGFDLPARAGGNGAAGGNGGAILSQSGDATLLNLTLVGNRAGGGGAGGRGGRGGDGTPGSPGFSGGAGGAGGNGGNGGALRRQLTGTAFLTHGTVVGNFAGAAGSGGTGGSGGIGSGGNGAPGPAGAGGAAGNGGAVSELGIVNAQFTQVTNSIVASNSPANCSPAGITDGGHSIAFGDASCPFPVQDPKLGPLQDNGGPVETAAPLAGSPAVDQVPAEGSGCPTADARGVPRPSPAGGLCDIGAVEISPPSCQPVSAGAVAGQPTQIQLTCTDLAGALFRFALLSQPAHGTLSAFDATAGRVTYTAAPGYTGADGFGFQGTTADGSASAAVGLTVTAPVAGGAPLLSALRVSPRRFRPARRGGSVASARRGTRVSFALDQAASVRFTVARRTVGRRSGRRCVAPTRRNRSARRCIRFVTVRGSFKRAGQPGVNSFRFTGRMRRRALTRGRYVLRARPSAAGVAGKTVRVAFTILR